VAGAGWLAGPARAQRKQPAPIRSAKLAHPISRPCVCGKGFKQQVHQPLRLGCGWADQPSQSSATEQAVYLFCLFFYVVLFSQSSNDRSEREKKKIRNRGISAPLSLSLTGG